jgi:hypothetical protein
MKHPRTSGHVRAAHDLEPDVEHLRLAASRLGGSARARGGAPLKALIAHADAIEHGRPTISPAKARVRPS